MPLTTNGSLKKSKKKFKKYMETYEVNHAMIQISAMSQKQLLRGKFIVIQAYLRKEISQTKNLIVH